MASVQHLPYNPTADTIELADGSRWVREKTCHVVEFALGYAQALADCASCAKDVLSRDEGTLVGKLLMGYWGYRCMREEANESR